MEIILQSENINFVQVSEKLIDDYLIMINNSEIQKAISTKRRIYSYEDEFNWVRDHLENNAVVFSMLEKSTGKFIGNIEYFDVKNESAVMGISITPAQQDKHFGTEAIKKFVEYGFEDLKLKEISLIVFSHNSRAKHVYESIGFVQYHIEKNVAVMDGESVDDIYMKITND